MVYFFSFLYFLSLFFFRSLHRQLNSMNRKVLIIVPAYNEEDTIVSVLNNVHNVNPDYHILVINDASRDSTSELAKSTGLANVIDLPINLGIGGAVQTGLKYAYYNNFEYAVQFDADGQHNAKDIPLLIGMLRKGECDVAVGSRFVGESKLFESDLFRRLGIRIFEFFSLILIQKRIRDHTSGFRAFTRKTIQFIMHEYPVDYPEPEIIVFLAKNKFVIKETFTQMYSRQGGASSISLFRGPYYMTKVLIAMVMAAIRPKEFNG